MTGDISNPQPPTERRRVDALLQKALDLDPEHRPAFLDKECPEHLRAKVERLLSVMDEDEDTAS